MNQDPRLDALNDPTDGLLQHEIEQALAVEPSPEFLARVRLRLADAPAPVARYRRWRLAVAVAVPGVVALLVAVWPDGSWEQAPDPGQPGQVAMRMSDAVLPVPAPAVEASPAPTADRRPGRTVAARQARTGAIAGFRPVDVLVSAEESAALRQLFRVSSEGRLTPAEWESGPQDEPLSVGALAIDPIELNSLPPIDGI